ncbi:MAG: MFS transporter [Dehalococcoidia bacterium]|nr:MFS transporter [Dehalococcoidia bacterium]
MTRLWPSRRRDRTGAAEANAAGESSQPPPASGQGGIWRFLPRTFDSFKDIEFRWFYLAMLGQMAAMNMQLVVRGYLAYDLTGSYAALGLVSLAGAGPMLGLSVFGGVLADRLPKRTVLQGGQFLSLVNAAFMSALLFMGLMTMPWLLGTAFAQGIVMALMMPARQSMVPEIVGMQRMMNAVSLNMAGMNTMRLFAPAAGGFIVELAGFRWAFFTMAVLYGVALSGLARVTWRPASSPGEDGTPMLKVGLRSLVDIKDGLSYIVHDRLMFTILAVSFVTSILGMPYLFLLPGYVSDIFGGSGSEVGLLISISAIGSLAGALTLASLPDRHRGLILLGGTMILAIGLIAFAQTSNYWLAAGFIVFVGLGSAFRQALTQGLLHSYVEDAYRGRVMSVFMTQFSLMQFGTFGVGVVAEYVGIQQSPGRPRCPPGHRRRDRLRLRAPPAQARLTRVHVTRSKRRPPHRPLPWIHDGP